MKPDYTPPEKDGLTTLYLRTSDKVFLLNEAQGSGLKIIDVVSALVTFAKEATGVFDKITPVIEALIKIAKDDGAYTPELAAEATSILEFLAVPDSEGTPNVSK